MKTVWRLNYAGFESRRRSTTKFPSDAANWGSSRQEIRRFSVIFEITKCPACLLCSPTPYLLFFIHFHRETVWWCRRIFFPSGRRLRVFGECFPRIFQSRSNDSMISLLHLPLSVVEFPSFEGKPHGLRREEKSFSLSFVYTQPRKEKKKITREPIDLQFYCIERRHERFIIRFIFRSVRFGSDVTKFFSFSPRFNNLIIFARSVVSWFSPTFPSSGLDVGHGDK